METLMETLKVIGEFRHWIVFIGLGFIVGKLLLQLYNWPLRTQFVFGIAALWHFHIFVHLPL
jgi:hypothetical protein